jgi:F0F1-type ATP synthase assembly protein I
LGEIKKRFLKDNPETEESVIEHQKVMTKIRNRVDRRRYNKMIGQPEDDEGDGRKGMQQYHASFAFGSSFITLMFLGFVLGYYIGKYAFGLPDIHWYVMSIVIGIGTMILETVLYIIKVEKIEGNERKRAKKSNIYKID